MNGDEKENDSQPRNDLRQEPAEGQKGNHKGSYHGQREKLGTNSFYQLRFRHVYDFQGLSALKYVEALIWNGKRDNGLKHD